MKEPELSFFQQLLAFAMLAGLGGVVHYLTTLKTRFERGRYCCIDKAD